MGAISELTTVLFSLCLGFTSKKPTQKSCPITSVVPCYITKTQVRIRDNLCHLVFPFFSEKLIPHMLKGGAEVKVNFFHAFLFLISTFSALCIVHVDGPLRLLAVVAIS